MRSLLLVLAVVATAACRPPVTHVHVDGPDAPRPQPGQFAVTGTATLDVRPDVADVHLTIAAESTRARTAATALRERQAAMRAALVAAGVEVDALTFTSLDIAPLYDVRGMTVRGYRASMALTATTAQFDALPDLLEVAVGAGATNVTTERRVLDLPARKREVRELALAAAKAKAEQTAAALGVKLGRVIAITEGSSDGSWNWNGRYGGGIANVAQVEVPAAAPSDGTVLAADHQTLSLTIAVSYEL